MNPSVNQKNKIIFIFTGEKNGGSFLVLVPQRSPPPRAPSSSPRAGGGGFHVRVNKCVSAAGLIQRARRQFVVSKNGKGAFNHPPAEFGGDKSFQHPRKICHFRVSVDTHDVWTPETHARNQLKQKQVREQVTHVSLCCFSSATLYFSLVAARIASNAS